MVDSRRVGVRGGVDGGVDVRERGGGERARGGGGDGAGQTARAVSSSRRARWMEEGKEVFQEVDEICVGRGEESEG